MAIKASNNQTLLDLAIQESGSADSWIDFAMLNGLVPTDTIIPGTSVEIPTNVSVNTDIVNFLVAKSVKPATAIATEILTQITPVLTCQEEIENCFK